MAGCCLGAVIMSPVVQYLTKEYGVSGMFLILGAIVLNCIPVAIILRNPRNEERNSGTNPKVEQEKSVSDNPLVSETRTQFENLGFVSDEEKQNGELLSVKISAITEQRKPKMNDTLEDLSKVKKCQLNDSCANKNESDSTSHLKLNYFPIEKKQKDFPRTLEVELVGFSEKSNFEDYCESPNKISINNNSEHCRTESNEKPSKTNNKKPVSWQLKHLFSDPAFYCIMLVNSLHAFVNTLNWTVIMDFGIDKGISPDLSVYFVMFLPVAEMIGLLSLNWVVDRKFMTRFNYAALCFVVLGLDSEFIEWSYNFPLTMVAVMIYGFLSGAVRSTFPGMIYDSIDKDKQSMAMASRGLPYGLLCFAKAPVVGYFRGRLGSYKGVYNVLTACGFLSALFSIMTPLAKSYRDRRKKISDDS